MPWFKVDDNLGFHHKVLAAGNPAMGLWVRAGSVCAQQLTDGFVADHMAATLGTRAQAERLVSVGLWTRVEGGYAFHEWVERQPSRVDVEAERRAAADRMRAYRERKRNAGQKASPQVSDSRSPERTPNERGTNAEVRDVFGNPDPTRPDPTSSKSDRPRKRAQQLSDEWQPSEAHVELANQRGIDLAEEVAKFRDWAASNGSTKKDWDATFRNWLRNAKPSGNVRPATPRPLHASEIEQPPDGLTDEEYAAWFADQRARRRA